MRKASMTRDGRIARDMILGALAGAAATWVMGRVTSYLYERESREAREREDEAREGKTAYGVAAEKAARLAGKELSKDERQKYGSAIHCGLGVGAGALYGAIRGRVPGADWGNGLAFGTAFWLLIDEGANTLLGLTPPPQEFPWQAHARGTIGHLVYGLVTESIFKIADGVVNLTWTRGNSGRRSLLPPRFCSLCSHLQAGNLPPAPKALPHLLTIRRSSE